VLPKQVLPGLPGVASLGASLGPIVFRGLSIRQKSPQAVDLRLFYANDENGEDLKPDGAPARADDASIAYGARTGRGSAFGRNVRFPKQRAQRAHIAKPDEMKVRCGQIDVLAAQKTRCASRGCTALNIFGADTPHNAAGSLNGCEGMRQRLL